MNKKEVDEINKSFKVVQDVLNSLLRRQDVFNQFWIDKLSNEDQEGLYKKLIEFDESEKPENKEKESKEDLAPQSTIRKNLQPTPRKEV